MPIISQPQDYTDEDLYVDLDPLLGVPLYVKCEGVNFAGSVKIKTARSLIDAAERERRLSPDSVLVESSSGNLGVAISMIAANRGIPFLCVTDPKCNPASIRLMEAYGATVHIVRDQDPNGGFLGARIAHIKKITATDSRYVWLNQYENPANWRIHFHETARAIRRAFPNLKVLFIGAGTTGTLMGCARYFKDTASGVTVVAVDAAGSVIFGGPERPRMIPGVGMSIRPPLLDEAVVDDVVRVAEIDAIRMCRRLAECGFLFGGSTGTVVSGAQHWLKENRTYPHGDAVAIAPDLGERYLDSIYDDAWVARHFADPPGPVSAL
ncbi:2,3-diaminopropionate biosynthesis protein SbnA [Nocardiopsis mangrovi]|uniref:2,3-diaminopropionate biosynthesis protein SbnA n=1 Tax=Nocardiopsis mangrovi TaxID=1179818 RepID=A0ABV9DZW2_9ACTN